MTHREKLLFIITIVFIACIISITLILKKDTSVAPEKQDEPVKKHALETPEKTDRKKKKSTKRSSVEPASFEYADESNFALPQSEYYITTANSYYGGWIYTRRNSKELSALQGNSTQRACDDCVPEPPAQAATGVRGEKVWRG